MPLCGCSCIRFLYRPQGCPDEEVEWCDQKGKDAQCGGPPGIEPDNRKEACSERNGRHDHERAVRPNVLG